jgi:hypothetical protein
LKYLEKYKKKKTGFYENVVTKDRVHDKGLHINSMLECRISEVLTVVVMKSSVFWDINQKTELCSVLNLRVY